MPWSEGRIVASAPDPRPHRPRAGSAQVDAIHTWRNVRAPAGRAAPAAPSPRKEDPLLDGSVYSHCSAEVPPLQLGIWRHVVFKMPDSWKAWFLFKYAGAVGVHSPHPTPTPCVPRGAVRILRELLLPLCQKSVGHMYAGLFLGSLFRPIDLCLSLLQRHSLV